MEVRPRRVHPRSSRKNCSAWLARSSPKACGRGLQANRPHRAQERLAWRYPLRARPLLGDSSDGAATECQGKDISLNGIGFYVPGQLPSSRLLLFMPQTPLTPEVAVVARVVRTQPCGDGWLEVGAVLEQPNVFPEGPASWDESRAADPAADLPKPAAPARASLKPQTSPVALARSRRLWMGAGAIVLAAGLGGGSGVFFRSVGPPGESPATIVKPPGAPAPVARSKKSAGAEVSGQAGLFPDVRITAAKTDLQDVRNQLTRIQLKIAEAKSQLEAFEARGRCHAKRRLRTHRPRNASPTCPRQPRPTSRTPSGRRWQAAPRSRNCAINLALTAELEIEDYRRRGFKKAYVSRAVAEQRASTLRRQIAAAHRLIESSSRLRKSKRSMPAVSPLPSANTNRNSRTPNASPRSVMA